MGQNWRSRARITAPTIPKSTRRPPSRVRCAATRAVFRRGRRVGSGAPRFGNTPTRPLRGRGCSSKDHRGGLSHRARLRAGSASAQGPVTESSPEIPTAEKPPLPRRQFPSCARTKNCRITCDLPLSHALLAWQVLRGLEPTRPPSLGRSCAPK